MMNLIKQFNVAKTHEEKLSIHNLIISKITKQNYDKKGQVK